MTTEEKATIARENGAKSHGPITEEGKQRSAMNAVKHGLTARIGGVIQGESMEIYTAFQNAFYDRFDPADDVERCMLDQMIMSCWRMRRISHYESELIEEQIEDMREDIDEQYDAIGEGTRGALAFRDLTDKSRVVLLITRYETNLRRNFQAAYKILLDLQAKRKPKPVNPEEPQPIEGLPNEPTPEPENKSKPTHPTPSEPRNPAAPATQTPEELLAELGLDGIVIK